jgi:predicted transcriptional regulator of viral defense system
MSKKILPAEYFIADYFNSIKKDYYVGLLQAAVYHGSSHQAVQSFSVLITKPDIRSIRENGLEVNFYSSDKLFKEKIIDIKVRTGYIKVSDPELTAADLIKYYKQVGGMNRVYTVLSELTESISSKGLIDLYDLGYGIAYLQRLGFLLDVLLGKTKLINKLHDSLFHNKLNKVLLVPSKKAGANNMLNKKWNVIVNDDLELDE